MNAMQKNLISEAPKLKEDIIFDKGSPGRKGYSLPAETGAAVSNEFSIKTKRKAAPRLPEVSEGEVVRHFTRLSSYNYHIDQNFYPLGSCTMKYNPRLNEEIAANPGLAAMHPAIDDAECQGIMELIYNLEQALLKITGMADISMQPAAGAHGELTGLFLVRDYFKDRGEDRKTVLIPDSAHGTNPASCTLAGLKVKTVPSTAEGTLDMDFVKANIDSDVAALMLTNPNTLGVFEKDILEVSEVLNKHGALLYMDGANFNAIVDKVDLAKTGVDVCHLNLHKTFSTPHGGGGPGSGPVVVSERLSPYLPGPKVKKTAGGFEWFTPEKSIGRVKGNFGHFGMFVRAYTYILAYGNEIGKIAEHAVLNANYMRKKLADKFEPASNLPMMHEVVISDKKQKDTGVTTLDFAKALLDYGFHPPTIYFPLVVSGAMMIEPTETESKEEMDRFLEVLLHLEETARTDPAKLQNRPYHTFIKKIDEVTAAREPKLNHFST